MAPNKIYARIHAFPAAAVAAAAAAAAAAVSAAAAASTAAAFATAAASTAASFTTAAAAAMLSSLDWRCSIIRSTDEPLRRGATTVPLSRPNICLYKG